MHKTESRPVASVPAAKERRFYYFCKRLMDLLLASLILVLAAPVMLLIALAIKLDSPGPVLFVQVRLGQNGSPFRFYKFRTMYDRADSSLHRRYVQSFIRARAPEGNGSASAATAAATFKLVHDPRVTRVGRLLRRSSLDELPQLFNVIRGDMSLVGPRPPLPYEVVEYQEWHRGRLAAVPGLTGLWQVRGRSRVTFDDMVRMDLEYIARQSLWLDLRILLLTVPAVLSGKGAA